MLQQEACKLISEHRGVTHVGTNSSHNNAGETAGSQSQLRGGHGAVHADSHDIKPPFQIRPVRARPRHAHGVLLKGEVLRCLHPGHILRGPRDFQVVGDDDAALPGEGSGGRGGGEV